MNKKFAILFIGIAIILTGIFLTVYTVSQQAYRMSANDPQIQLAEDTVNQLNNGLLPKSLAMPQKIDLEKSIAPFIIIYDIAGQPLVSSASLNSQTPILPQGVFDYVKKYGEDRLTWQPASTVREAIVVKSFNAGFVLAGRSLLEVEKRESQLTYMVGLAWLSSLIVLVCTGILLRPKAVK